MPTSNPHDTFLKKLLSEPKYAVELFQTMLPKQIVDRLDWRSLRQTQDHFVDARLRAFFSDALFSIERKKESVGKTPEKVRGLDPQKIDAANRNQDSIRLYLLFEHKSTPGKGIHLQLLKYLTRIYDRMQGALVPVLPIVFYHGKQNWSIPEAFIDTFYLGPAEKEMFRKYVPDFSYELYDLSREELEQARLSIELRAILDVLKNIWYFNDDAELRRWVKDAALLLQAWHEGKGDLEDLDRKKMLELLLVYVYSCIEIEPERLKEVFSSVRPEYGEIAMTTAEMLIEKGIEKGELRAKIESARNLLHLGVEWPVVLKATGLSEETLQEYGLPKKAEDG